MRFIYFLLILLLTTICYAEIKEFSKSATEAVPNHQSQEQVIQYVTQMLSREAIEEAGVFIKSHSELIDNKLTKDEITSITGSVAEIIVTEKKPLIINNKNFVSVSVKIKIDTDIVESYLTKIKDDNTYKNEALELQKKNLELEKALKRANKGEFELKLSVETEKMIEEQRQRALQLTEIALEAKKRLARVERRQKKQELERLTRINELKIEIEKQELATRKRIAEEKDELKKAELENFARIKELENKAKENVAAWQVMDTLYIEDVKAETIILREVIAKIIKDFNDNIATNQLYIAESYNKEIYTLKGAEFPDSEPAKDAWQSNAEFINRQKIYEKQKRDYIKTSYERGETLEQEKELALILDKHGSLRALNKSLEPFYDRLNSFQTIGFYDKGLANANITSMGMINADNKTFLINVEYNKKSYGLIYDFSDMGISHAKAIYTTNAYFVITPKFSLSDNNSNIEMIPTYFNVKHLGAGTEKEIKIPAAIVKEFKEVKQIKDYINNLAENIVNISKHYVEQGNAAESEKWKLALPFDRGKNLELLDNLSFINAEECYELGDYYEKKNLRMLAKDFYIKSYLKNKNAKARERISKYEIKLPNYYGAFSPDGKYILMDIDTKGKYLKIVIFDSLTGKEINQIKRERYSIVSSRFTQDRNHIILLDKDFYVTKYNFITGNVVSKVQLNIKKHNKITMSANGKYVATSENGDFYSTLQIFDTKSGEKITSMNLFSSMYFLSFVNSEKYLFIDSYYGGLRVLNIDTKEIHKIDKNGYKSSIAFSQYNQYYVIENHSKGLEVWNGEKTKLINIIHNIYRLDTNSIYFSPNNKCILTLHDDKIGIVVYYPFATKRHRFLENLKKEEIHSVVFSPDSYFLIVHYNTSTELTFIGDICQ